MLQSPVFDIYERLGLRPRSEAERAQDAIHLARSELAETCKMVEASQLPSGAVHVAYLKLVQAETHLLNLRV